jgi:selenophosphate synthetase-related protein
MNDVVKKHFSDILWIRDELAFMDTMISPVMGAADFDDAVCVDFKGRLLASTDGPYDMRLVMKSALVHAATDVVVKGGVPLFALDNLNGREEDVRQMLESLKIQAEFLKIPIIGGNTKIEEATPTACVTVFGKLLLDEPIRDCGANSGDVIALFGQPIWGQQEERLRKAKAMFEVWYDVLKEVRINSAKDVTKGGLISCIHEMEVKSRKKFKIDEYPYHKTRNLDNFLITLSEQDYNSLNEGKFKEKIQINRIGTVL